VAENGSPRTIKQLTDPKALRALAHPTRLKLLGQLRIHGQLTATQAGELLGESSASCSFHLRQLAKYGLVEETGGGQGRERPWRATTMFTGWPDYAEDPKVDAAADLLRGVIADQYISSLMRWLEAKPDEPEEWQQAAQLGDTLLYLTADELAELGEQARDLVDPYLDRQASPELRPPGARLVTYLHIAHPVVDAPSQPAPGQPAPGQLAPGQPAPSQPAPGQPAPSQPAPDC
jgi:DNA-binding transcriptional ArsR family regulator